MNSLKAEVKILVATDIGARIEDSFEAAQKEVLRQEGEILAFAKAAKAVEALGEHVKRDLDEGKFDLEVAGLINRYLERAAQAARGLGAQADGIRLVANGKIAGFESAMKIVLKFREEEAAKLQALKESLAAGSEVVKAEGEVAVVTRPAMTIKERRLAEAAAAEAKEAPETAPEAETVQPVAHAPKKRGRPRKAA